MVIISPIVATLSILFYLGHLLFALLVPVRFTKWILFHVPGASWLGGDIEASILQPHHSLAPQLQQLPSSGEVLEYDFRNGTKTDNPKTGQPLRVVSYNIGLGKNLEGIIEELQCLTPIPDIIFLQEDNIYQLPPPVPVVEEMMMDDDDNILGESSRPSLGSTRSTSRASLGSTRSILSGGESILSGGILGESSRSSSGSTRSILTATTKKSLGSSTRSITTTTTITNTPTTPARRRPFYHAGAAIAKEMGMSCMFVNAHYRGDPECNGVYGMSILSQYKLRHHEALKCEQQPYIVDKMTTWLKGERHFPYAEIGEGDSAVALSSVHLPSMGKLQEKMIMMSNLFDQMQLRQRRSNQYTIPSIIGGDMNTAPFFFRWILPFGSKDLYCSCRSETHLFRTFLETQNYFDPFRNDDGTYIFPGWLPTKLDWIIFHQDDFTLETYELERSPETWTFGGRIKAKFCWLFFKRTPKRYKDANISFEENTTHKTTTASDHRWISVTLTPLASWEKL